MTKFAANPVFHWSDVELRELKLFAWKPAAACGAAQSVIYRGPFARIVTDAGERFLRGVPTAVDAATSVRLQRDPWRGQFLLLDAATDSSNMTRCATQRADHHRSAETVA
jgi:hypothetical protein